MRNIYDHNEYNAYKNTSDGSNNSGGSGSNGPSFGGWIVIGIVIFMLISFIVDSASWEAIETLLAFGLIAYLFINWLTK